MLYFLKIIELSSSGRAAWTGHAKGKKKTDKCEEEDKSDHNKKLNSGYMRCKTRFAY